ncbi:hypothetical protein ES288_A05G462000v1 [Gossypium darwinii]|uniref:Uncharacterized protein n=1 Tax=Gossypium darwinii TaxID=34276 RepID=A0A5D2GSI7_GOSDA|nr:hypothetical protein ES288_A05G462000v1 [Gossypium darwinii]
MILNLFLLHYFRIKGMKERPMNCECQVLSQHGRAIGLDKVGCVLGGVLQTPLKFLILFSGVNIYIFQLN